MGLDIRCSRHRIYWSHRIDQGTKMSKEGVSSSSLKISTFSLILLEDEFWKGTEAH